MLKICVINIEKNETDEKANCQTEIERNISNLIEIFWISGESLYCWRNGAGIIDYLFGKNNEVPIFMVHLHTDTKCSDKKT